MYTRTYTIHIYLNTYRETRSSGAGGVTTRNPSSLSAMLQLALRMLTLGDGEDQW